ncbi:hypothetical protein D3C80_1647300 [compost metagenome]
MMPSTALSVATSGRKATAFLPPSSSVARVSLAPMAAWPTAMPVGTEPVNETLSVPACSISALPTRPPPVSTFSAPAGRPASVASSAMRSSVSGVNSLGLRIMLQPVVRAEASFQMAIMLAKFHGTMPTTTPIGSRRVKAL